MFADDSAFTFWLGRDIELGARTYDHFVRWGMMTHTAGLVSLLRCTLVSLWASLHYFDSDEAIPPFEMGDRAAPMAAELRLKYLGSVHNKNFDDSGHHGSIRLVRNSLHQAWKGRCQDETGCARAQEVCVRDTHNFASSGWLRMLGCKC